MRDLDRAFEALAHSSFRMRFRLNARGATYLKDKGADTIRAHAREFIAARLAPASPRNDGKQTPMRDHPVFVAPHATATCCRSCLAKWHGIEKGQALTADQQAHILAAIERWLAAQGGTSET